MRIVVLHQSITEQDTVEDQDVLVQVDAVAVALRQLGHTIFSIPCGLNLEYMLNQVRAMRPDLVFNLVESLGGSDSLVYLSHAVLDAAGIPYAGNRTEAHFLTAHKLLAKQRLHSAGLPTPAWIEDCGFVVPPSGGFSFCSRLKPGLQTTTNNQPSPPAPLPKGEGSERWIVKGVWDQASRDLDDEAIVLGANEQILQAIDERVRRTGRPSFAELFIEGREFNIGLLADPTGVEVLPPAEIDFSAFPPEKPRIVGHRAKWAEDSFEYNNTPRTFEFPQADGPLLDELRSMAKKCWELFSLRGWARVDFRVDAESRPWILEINTNPCLSPDAGFFAALGRAGIPFETAIRRIVEEATHSFPRSGAGTQFHDAPAS